MKYASRDCELEAVLHTAQQICAAIRTAPKAKGVDHLRTCVLTGAEKDALADKMVELAEPLKYGFFIRDANNVRQSDAVVLVGAVLSTRGLNDGCQYCGFQNCAACIAAGGTCAYEHIDLGIAVGSAVAMAADARIDSRVMFSIGRAAMELGLPDAEARSVMGIPLSVSGKSPFFDRK
jgi:uncharacterized ferredoxin-like protein